jgi:hypothetical protein
VAASASVSEVGPLAQGRALRGGEETLRHSAGAAEAALARAEVGKMFRRAKVAAEPNAEQRGER